MESCNSPVHHEYDAGVNVARTLPLVTPRCHMRELESSLQEFGMYLLKAQLARPSAAPYFVRWVRRFLSRPASDGPLTEQVRGFCEELERTSTSIRAWSSSAAAKGTRTERNYSLNWGGTSCTLSYESQKPST